MLSMQLSKRFVQQIVLDGFAFVGILNNLLDCYRIPIFIIERNRFVSMNFKPLFCFSLFQKFHVQKEARLLCGIRTASKPTILIYH